jgi:excisionase family DNA binding protein
MRAIDEPHFLTGDDVAALLRTTRKAVYVMVERGQLPGVTRIGRRLLFHRDDLLDWLRQKRAPSPKG